MSVTSHEVWGWFEHGVLPVGLHLHVNKKPPDHHSRGFFTESAELPRFRLLVG